MRIPIIAGNWKMHNTIDEAIKLVRELKPMVKDAKCEVVVCPTFVCLHAVKKAVEGTNIKVGAQNMHFEEKGAFTGEVSPLMLQDMGIDYVIIGHSERRQYFNDTDETINKKIKAAFDHDLIPILCVGETLDERESDITEEVIAKQVRLDLANIPEELVENIVIAYEPIWAIGTGKTATSAEANETIAFIRGIVENIYGKNVADKVRIQYGGSVKPATINEQMSMSDIDGALVGGASLKSEDFAAIVNF
ncbi:triosephosphate isomerase [Clostridium pascui]|uniref:triose-phosphate isomerase n=1 Tax=Clostridium pascui TaxID=46609 RepID=UPI0019585FEF|nr:triose-phosphate isomerase [Clostridium pascui]MBM7870488.1 triosephosphate isomerase [Clostridium pascui]